jgi:hypothetical protein
MREPAKIVAPTKLLLTAEPATGPGKVVAYIYDSRNRLIKKRYFNSLIAYDAFPDSVPVESLVFSYDAVGNMVSMLDKNGTIVERQRSLEKTGVKVVETSRVVLGQKRGTIEYSKEAI